MSSQSRPRPLAAADSMVHKEFGVSLVELLVGLAIGLFLLAGGLSLFANQSQRSVQVLLETQLNRNLRQAMDFITQDLRRAGAWENALAAAPSPNATPVMNPHAALSSTAASIDYSYGQDTARGQPSSLNLSNVDEQFGLRLNAGVLESAVGQGQWQALTDLASVEVTRLSVVPRSQTIPAGDACRKLCCDAVMLPRCPQINAPQGCPKLQRWSFEIEIDGQSRRDPTLTRRLQGQVQVRNELLVGACPA